MNDWTDPTGAGSERTGLFSSDEAEVLVVEDSATQALSLQYLLEREGYRVRICGSGAEAQDAIRRFTPSLVISDIVMPGMDGYQLCEWIRADPALTRLPVILVTTLNDPADVLRGLEAGADSFMLKPYDDPALVSRIRFALLNNQLKQHDRSDIGVEIDFHGRSHFINSGRLQMLNLLLSTYEAAIRRNEELRQSQDEFRQENTALSAANLRLEEEVRRRRIVEAELAAAKEQAEAANEAKSAFLATMSHEIRTPMNGIVGMVDVLAHTALGEQQRDSLRTIQESASTLLQLIDDVLDFSKIEAGRLELEEEPVSLADLAEGVCDTLSAVAERKAVDLFLFVSPDGPSQVLADSVRLRQVLYNLVGNAIKFSAGRDRVRGRVEVRVEVAREAPLLVRFRVADNGIGIAQDALPGLFESFRQAEVSTTRRYGGTGLGLAICRRLVQLMGGSIRVGSEVGAGTTFEVLLPLQAATGSRPLPLPDLSGVDYVVVDGPFVRAQDLRAYLARAGATVEVVADADEALRRSSALPSPVVVHGGIVEDERAAWLARFADLAHVRHLLIARGRRRVARLAGPGVVSIDGNALRRRTLIHAAAAAAGLALPATEKIDPADVLQMGQAAPTVAEARRRGELILVAEDDGINQKVLLRQLGLLGYAAEVASDGEEALALWRTGRFALVLTDLHMPAMDGYALATAIRDEEAPARRVPIVALTANALHGEASRALAAGMDGYLTKPLQLPALREALAQWLPHVAHAAQPAPGAGSQEHPPGEEAEALVGGFRAGLPQESARLRTALAVDDLREVGRIAHRLKAASRAAGAPSLADLCAQIENGATLSDKTAVAAAIAAFEQGAGAGSDWCPESGSNRHGLAAEGF